MGRKKRPPEIAKKNVGEKLRKHSRRNRPFFPHSARICLDEIDVARFGPFWHVFRAFQAENGDSKKFSGFRLSLGNAFDVARFFI